jgi:two-component system, sensor histidine kinase
VTDAATILVVDDQDAGRFVKVMTLRRAGFTVIEANTGTDALTLVANERPHLVILDVNLPDISGFEVARRLRSAESGPPTLQILQISGTSVAPADRVKGLEHGADVYLTEPVDAVVLVATVRALLRVRRAETELAAALDGERRARQVVEEANRLKDEFIATLSHELRTPLNAMMGWIWQLRHTKLGDEAHDRALDSLERNTRMQAQLINDLLDVSRISKGKLQLEMRLVDLKNEIDTVAESLQESIASKHLSLRLDLTPVCVAGDQGRLQQIVTNLMTNAIQFTPVGGSISVMLATDGDDAVLSVKDTGAGIEPTFLPFVFDQFRQGEGGLSRKHGGLGLGLAVVQQLVDLHAGSVTVTSPGLNQGTTFTVRLPRETTLTVDPIQTPLILRDVNVLLVTKDEVDASALKGSLESSGARVAVATSASESVAMPKDFKADLVVTDDGESGVLTFGAPAPRTSETLPTLPKSARPGDVVRRIARLMAESETS